MKLVLPDKSTLAGLPGGVGDGAGRQVVGTQALLSTQKI